VGFVSLRSIRFLLSAVPLIERHRRHRGGRFRRNPTVRRGTRWQEAIVAASAAPYRRQHHERGLRAPSDARTDVSSQMAIAY
jgi:hypothetical protein